MHITMMLRVLNRMTDEQVAARILDENLPQADRNQAMEEFKRRGLIPKRPRPRQRAWNRA